MTHETKTDSSTKFTKDILWVGLSQILIYLFGFFTLPALTKNFGAETYGLWAQIGVTVGLLNPILTLHLGTATVRYLSAENRKEKLSQAFSNMFWLIVLIVLITIAAAFLLKNDLSILLFKSNVYDVFVILTFIWAGTGALFAFLIAYLRSKGKIKELSFINILCYSFKFIPLVVLAFLHFPLWFIVIVQISVEFIFILSLFGSITKKVGFRKPSTANLKKYLSFSIPQIPSGALLWIIDSSDRYFTTSYLGLSQTGIYSASYSIGSLVSMFYVPISFVIFPVISSFWEMGKVPSVKKYLEYSTKIFLFFGVPGSAGLYILSKPLLQILTTSEFLAGGGTLTLLIALSTLFLGIYQINLYIICLIEKTKFMPFIVGLSAVTNIVLNMLLIPRMGIMGAAISTIVSYAALSLIVLIWAKKRVNYRFDFVFLFKIVLASILMVIVIGILPLKGILNIIIAVVVGIAIYLVSVLALKTLSKKEKKFVHGFIMGIKDQIFH
jgi:O-antigen/teichoic acid export membrane protein